MSNTLHPVEGIYEKLKRAHENIINLEREANGFFQEGENVIVGDEDLEVLLQKAKYQGERELPLRFAVLVGEILHHFRSSLDHAAWLLARPDWRIKRPTKIEFPVFHDRFDKNGSPSLKGKIEMFSSKAVQKFVEGIQPYEGPDPSNDMLWLIHDLDRKAKHRELPLMATGFDLGGPQINALVAFYTTNPIQPIPEDVRRQLKKNVRISPHIVFGDFVKGKPQPVIFGLGQLERQTRKIIELLADELWKC